MQKSVYFPDTDQMVSTIARVEILSQLNKRSFSELVVEGLGLLIEKNHVKISTKLSNSISNLSENKI